jgi:crotonobetainyl-CoA:carnitine CoA-transferase CaiB-like acyl-CoA transferase
MLAEAGAEVIKIERPRRGDEMRSYEPRFGSDSVNFALLNRGKRSIAIDLKSADAAATLRPLIESADVAVEQFRPGVMDRLGLGYDTLRKINPRIIYCALTGYGQHGPRADVAAHDLNYVAESGLLMQTKGSDGAPVLPAALVADIAGGTYPAVINILLALRERDRTGVGCKLDVAMADNLFTLMYWGLGNGMVANAWPRSGGDLVTGGSPRYNIYRTKDDRFLAAAPLEQKFWENFCALLDVPAALRDDSADAAKTKEAVAERVRARTASELSVLLKGHDVCCAIAVTLEDAMKDEHFAARGLFARGLTADGKKIPALPVPVAEAFRSGERDATYPRLGEGNDLLSLSSEPSPRSRGEGGGK